MEKGKKGDDGLADFDGNEEEVATEKTPTLDISFD